MLRGGRSSAELGRAPACGLRNTACPTTHLHNRDEFGEDVKAVFLGIEIEGLEFGVERFEGDAGVGPSSVVTLPFLAAVALDGVAIVGSSAGVFDQHEFAVS